MSIRSLNVTWIGADTDTFVAPFDGDVEITVGGKTSSVVKVHVTGEDRVFPEISRTVVIEHAYVLDDPSGDAGVNVAVLST